MRIQLPLQNGPRSGLFLPRLLGAGALAVFIFWSPFFCDFASSPSPLAVQNFMGDVQASSFGATHRPLRRGEAILFSDRVKTGSDSELDLQGPGFSARLKENSEIEIQKTKNFFQKTVSLHLLQGTLLTADSENHFEISAGGLSRTWALGTFRLRFFLPRLKLDLQKAVALLKLAEGLIKAQTLSGDVRAGTELPLWAALRPLQKAETPNRFLRKLRISKISQAEWNELREGYELLPKSPSQEARQLDLAKKAGNFFEYAFDHGAFYRQDYGYAEREFYEAQDTKEVRLKMLYDVFPPGSVAGVYFKTRNLEIPHFNKFTFEMRKVPGMESPAGFQIELKYKLKIVRLYAISEEPPASWKKIELPLRVYENTPITEIVFVFPHERVGDFKKGGLELRSLTLEQAPKPASKPSLPPVPGSPEPA